MKRILSYTLLLAASASTLTATDYFQQPTEEPSVRKWEAKPQELPPLSEIMGRPAQERPVYGIYIWGGEYELAYKEIDKMGVRSLRIAGPAYESDKALQIAAEHDVEIMYTVDNASTRDDYRQKRKRGAYETDEEYLASIKQTYEEFMDKYGPNGTNYAGTGLKSPVAAVEIMNEPNYHYIIPDRQPRKEVEAEREALYAKILPTAGTVVHEHENPLPVVGFACGGGGATCADSRFVKGVYRDGGDDVINPSYDIFSTHPYMDGAPPEGNKIKPWGSISLAKNTTNMRNILAENGKKPDFWWTEVGYEIGHQYGGQFKTDKKKPDDLLTEDEHAMYIIRTYLWAMRLGVDRVFVMHMHDTDNYNSGIVHRGSLEWRPVAHAIKNITTLMPNPKLAGAQADGVDNSYIFEFISDHTKGNKADTIVAWNILEPTEVDITVPGKSVTVYDLVGNEKQVDTVDGKVHLEIGPYPLYIKY